MIVRRHKSSHIAAAFAVLAFVVAGLGLPILLGGDGHNEGGLVAAPRDRFQITEPLTIKGLPGVRIERGTLALADVYAAKIMSGEAVTALLASGSARLVLDGASILLDRTVGAGQEAAVEGMAPLAAVISEANFDALSIRRSVVVFVGEDGRRDTIGEANFEVAIKRKSSVSGRGTLSVLGQKLSFDAVMGLLPDRRSASQVKHVPLRVSVKGPMLEAQLDGKFVPGEAAPIQGQGEISVRNGRDAARWLGFGWPAGPGFADFKIKGPVEWSRQAVAFQRATMQMDGNEAQGALSVTFAGGRPDVSGTLALQTLDLRGYLSAWQGDARRSIIEDVLAPGPFAFPLVRFIDADLRISANRVLADKLEFGQSAATLSIKSGKLRADVAEVTLDAARGSGQLMIDTNSSDPRFVVRGKLSNIEVSRLLPDGASAMPLQGRGEFVADVAAVGQTSTDLLRTLSGKISLAMPTGARVGMDLKGLLASAQKQPVSGWALTRRGSTTVDSLQGRIVVSEGVIYTEAFSAALGDALMTASGGGNLKSGMLDVKLSLATGKSGDRGTAGPLIDSLTFRGPWHEPSIRAERTPSAISAPAGLP